jgi:short subunit dehydrogenase-like uncharacterized protein
VIEGMASGGLVRRGGRLMRVPAAYRTRMIDFGEGPVKAVTIPWGDVVTAYYSTGIPDIELYMAASLSMRVGMRVSRYAVWLLGSRPVQTWLERRVRAGPPGASADARKRGRSLLWGEAIDDASGRVVTRLRGPQAYDLTVQAALAIVRRVLGGAVPPGLQTPATACGRDLCWKLMG